MPALSHDEHQMFPSPYDILSISDVLRILTRVGMGSYSEAFIANGFGSWSSFLFMTASDLQVPLALDLNLVLD